MSTSKETQFKNHWYKEWLSSHEAHLHQFKKTVLQARTPFQKAVIGDSYAFGRCLILDGEIQSAEKDEFIYHESLVHPILFAHPHPKSVLVLGGGEGATLRELLKHKTLKKIVMVDIDGAVVEFCKKHMRTWHQGSFDNPRVQLIIDDAKKYIESTDDRFDVILSDLPTPSEAGELSLLYTVSFYKTLLKRLNKGGLVGLQAGSGNFLQFKFHQNLYSTLKRIFNIVRPYYAYIPSFTVPWGFFSAAKKQDPLSFSAPRVDRLIKSRLKGSLHFYDGMTHVGLMNIPLYLRNLLQQEKK